MGQTTKNQNRTQQSPRLLNRDLILISVTNRIGAVASCRGNGEDLGSEWGSRVGHHGMGRTMFPGAELAIRGQSEGGEKQYQTRPSGKASRSSKSEKSTA